MTNAKILIADDDRNICELLKIYFEKEGSTVVLAGDGEEALSRFDEENPDIILLDVMMPKKDGFTLAQDIRKINNVVPIVFLTAKTLKDDVLEGFRIGADDYITKPFSMEEMLLRIEAIMRRISGKKNKNGNEYQIGSMTFDVQKQTLTTSTNIVKLTTKECELLSLLVQNANNILERDYALKTIWLECTTYNARSMDVYITKLRKIIKDDPEVEIINIHGKGYKLIIPE